MTPANYGSVFSCCLFWQSDDALSLCILQKQTIYLKKRNLCDLSCCRSCHDPYAFALEFSFCNEC